LTPPATHLTCHYLHYGPHTHLPRTCTCRCRFYLHLLPHDLQSTTTFLPPASLHTLPPFWIPAVTVILSPDTPEALFYRISCFFTFLYSLPAFLRFPAFHYHVLTQGGPFHSFHLLPTLLHFCIPFTCHTVQFTTTLTPVLLRYCCSTSPLIRRLPRSDLHNTTTAFSLPYTVTFTACRSYTAAFYNYRLPVLHHLRCFTTPALPLVPVTRYFVLLLPCH